MRIVFLLLLGSACPATVPDGEDTGLVCPGATLPSVAVTLVEADGSPAEPDVDLTYQVDLGPWQPCRELDPAAGAWVCGDEEAGTITVRALRAMQATEVTVQVEQGACNVVTVPVTLEVPPGCGDVAPPPALTVHVTTPAGDDLDDARVAYLPLGQGATNPEPCTFIGAGSFVCVEQDVGDFEVWAISRGFLEFYQVVTVDEGPCGPEPVLLEAVLERR